MPNKIKTDYQVTDEHALMTSEWSEEWSELELTIKGFFKIGHNYIRFGISEAIDWESKKIPPNSPLWYQGLISTLRVTRLNKIIKPRLDCSGMINFDSYHEFRNYDPSRVSGSITGLFGRIGKTLTDDDSKQIFFNKLNELDGDAIKPYMEVNCFSTQPYLLVPGFGGWLNPKFDYDKFMEMIWSLRGKELIPIHYLLTEDIALKYQTQKPQQTL